MLDFQMEQVLSAIEGSGGIMSNVARKLDCAWDTAKAYCLKWDETKQALVNEQETILDIAENTLVDKIKEGDEQSAKWYLSKKGKHRGYGDSVAIEGGIQIVYADKDDERL